MIRPKVVKRSSSRAEATLRHDAASLYNAMTALLRVYQFRDRDHVGYYGLTVTQCYVIECLIRGRALTLTQLASAIGLEKSTLSRVVDTLERKGFITKRRNPLDGRSTLLSASSAGEARYRSAEEDIIRENCKVLSDFPARIRRQIVPVLDALTKAAATRDLETVDD